MSKLFGPNQLLFLGSGFIKDCLCLFPSTRLDQSQISCIRLPKCSQTYGFFQHLRLEGLSIVEPLCLCPGMLILLYAAISSRCILCSSVNLSSVSTEFNPVRGGSESGLQLLVTKSPGQLEGSGWVSSGLEKSLTFLAWPLGDGSR